MWAERTVKPVRYATAVFNESVGKSIPRTLDRAAEFRVNDNRFANVRSELVVKTA